MSADAMIDPLAGDLPPMSATDLFMLELGIKRQMEFAEPRLTLNTDAGSHIHPILGTKELMQFVMDQQNDGPYVD